MPPPNLFLNKSKNKISTIWTYALTLKYAFLNTYNPNKVLISLNENNVLCINTSTNTTILISHSQNIIINQY